MQREYKARGIQRIPSFILLFMVPLGLGSEDAWVADRVELPEVAVRVLRLTDESALVHLTLLLRDNEEICE